MGPGRGREDLDSKLVTSECEPLDLNLVNRPLAPGPGWDLGLMPDSKHHHHALLSFCAGTGACTANEYCFPLVNPSAIPVWQAFFGCSSLLSASGRSGKVSGAEEQVRCACRVYNMQNFPCIKPCPSGHANAKIFAHTWTQICECPQPEHSGR